MDRLDYQKPEITIIHAEPERMLAASGQTSGGDTFHNANTQKDSVIDLHGGDEEHDGSDDLEAAKIYHRHFDLWEMTW